VQEYCLNINVETEHLGMRPWATYIYIYILRMSGLC